jgi:hypothetical protein
MARPKGSKNSPKQEQSEQPEQPPKQSSDGLTLYVVNYWVPFPASEYGGMQVVIAHDDEECFKIIYEADEWERKYQKDAEELIRARVKKASRFKLDGGYIPEMVRSFTT